MEVAVLVSGPIQGLHLPPTNILCPKGYAGLLAVYLDLDHVLLFDLVGA
jgi:hypothetical protein